MGSEEEEQEKRREAEGDFLGVDQPSLLLSDDTIVAPCFASLFQGGHLGVEIATEAHAGMLEAYGLLKSPSRLQSGVCLQDDLCVEGLYIDDYFAISREDARARARVVGLPSEQDLQRLSTKQRRPIHLKKFLDQTTKMCSKAIASKSCQFLVEGGLVSCGLPAEKRLSLAMAHLCLLRFR